MPRDGSSDHPASTDYGSAVARLAAEVEHCLGDAGSDREASLQRDAFAERLDRARALAERMGRATADERRLLDGDAWRVWQALELSRDFFLGRTGR